MKIYCRKYLHYCVDFFLSISIFSSFRIDVTKFQTIVYYIDGQSNIVEKYNGPVDLSISYDPQGISCKFTTGEIF